MNKMNKMNKVIIKEVRSKLPKKQKQGCMSHYLYLLLTKKQSK